MSKNIFNYAKKELSQDAFLMWLLDSFDSDNQNEKETSIDFINFLIGLKENEVINKISIKPQRYNIDVTAVIITNQRKIGLFIEDKINSCEHDQLARYNKDINKIVNAENINQTDIKKIFYKTNSIDEGERKRVKDAGWTEISFKSINDFWNKYTNLDHLFINQYANHICKLYIDSENVNIPLDNNIWAWKSFFDKIIIPTIRNDVYCYTFNYKNFYTAINIKPKGKIEEKMPYLEIRSRDCISGIFNAKILMYEVDFSNNPNGLNEIRDEIRKHDLKGIFKGNYGAKKIRQVAHSPRRKLKYKNIDDFKKLTSDSIKEYLSIVSFWK